MIHTFIPPAQVSLLHFRLLNATVYLALPAGCLADDLILPCLSTCFSQSSTSSRKQLCLFNFPDKEPWFFFFLSPHPILPQIFLVLPWKIFQNLTLSFAITTGILVLHSFISLLKYWGAFYLVSFFSLIVSWTVCSQSDARMILLNLNQLIQFFCAKSSGRIFSCYLE